MAFIQTSNWVQMIFDSVISRGDFERKFRDHTFEILGWGKAEAFSDPTKAGEFIIKIELRIKRRKP